MLKISFLSSISFKWYFIYILLLFIIIIYFLSWTGKNVLVVDCNAWLISADWNPDLKCEFVVVLNTCLTYFQNICFILIRRSGLIHLLSTADLHKKQIYTNKVADICQYRNKQVCCPYLGFCIFRTQAGCYQFYHICQLGKGGHWGLGSLGYLLLTGYTTSHK